MRYFNTGGPCVPDLHYMLAPEPRLPGARERVERSQCFVLHAPRQTGKTTSLLALARDLTEEGRHVALVVSCEVAKTTGDDVGAAGRAILGRVAAAARRARLAPELMPPQPWPEAGAEEVLSVGLEAWALACPLALVLFFDEVDALRGKSLLSFLAQVRDGFAARPYAFPKSVVLCGLRDVRDYRIASGKDPEVIGSSSPFNVSVKSYRLANFTAGEVAELYGQHAAETGQEFTPDAVRLAFEYTQGLWPTMTGKRTAPVSAAGQGRDGVEAGWALRVRHPPPAGAGRHQPARADQAPDRRGGGVFRLDVRAAVAG